MTILNLSEIILFYRLRMNNDRPPFYGEHRPREQHYRRDHYGNREQPYRSEQESYRSGHSDNVHNSQGYQGYNPQGFYQGGNRNGQDGSFKRRGKQNFNSRVKMNNVKVNKNKEVQNVDKKVQRSDEKTPQKRKSESLISDPKAPTKMRKKDSYKTEDEEGKNDEEHELS